MLSPEHLRYLARQLKLILTLRKVEPMAHLRASNEAVGSGSEEVAEINRWHKAYNKTDVDLIDRDQARLERLNPKKKLSKEKQAVREEIEG